VREVYFGTGKTSRPRAHHEQHTRGNQCFRSRTCRRPMAAAQILFDLSLEVGRGEGWR